ncbi:MAG: MBL fold metallo-hydrolase [Bacteroidota bacterium]
MSNVVLQNDQVTVFESALYRTTTTLVDLGEALLLVDPNWLPAELAKIRAFVDSQMQGRPLYLLFTHADYDHILGWKVFPEANVIASKAFQQLADKEARIADITKFDQEYYIQRSYPIAFPEVDFAIARDGQRLSIGGQELCFYHAPGHTAEGIFTVIDSLGLWIAGDYLSNVEFPFVYHSFAAYRGCMQKARRILEEHPIRLLVPGHGDVANSSAEILSRIDASEAYLTAVWEGVQKSEDVPLSPLAEAYPFPGGLQKPHVDNVAQARKELGVFEG